jgi:hypothetical protein
VQAGSGPEVEKKNNLLGASPGVLNSFEFQQEGNAVRILDQDGSVYSGTIEAQASLVGLATPGGAVEGRVQTNSSATIARNRVVASSYRFKVSGTNLSSGEMVLFKGELRPAIPAVLHSSMSATKRLEPASSNSFADKGLTITNSEMTGDLIIGSRTPTAITAHQQQPRDK